MLEVLKVIILGIVQGITEWLPISSTGHLILVEQLIQLKQSEAKRPIKKAKRKRAKRQKS